MEPRLQLARFDDEAGLVEEVSKVVSDLTDGMWEVPKAHEVQKSEAEHATLYQCLKHAFALGARSVIVQRRVLDPDYLAEFTAYYSRRFSIHSRNCARLHFFRRRAAEDALSLLDAEGIEKDYLGFVTLRPVGSLPVGATMLAPGEGVGNIRCLDHFPVHLGGTKLHVIATPFMQQDNAVGACGQASIWMALRTMRKREGDRAFDPAQITGEATRFSTVTRILPNRGGLTDEQMLDAVHGTGYSPHLFSLTTATSVPAKQAEELQIAKQQIAVYLDSEIPVLLGLYSDGGHAVVAIGYTFSATSTSDVQGSQTIGNVPVPITHTANWIEDLIIHNDNSGPYLRLPDRFVPELSSYHLGQAEFAIPLLPVDVYLTGEEAMTVALGVWRDVLADLIADLGQDVRIAFAGRFALRLLLLDRRRVRSWAKKNGQGTLLSSYMRMADLPRRIWALEIHLKDDVGKHATEAAKSMVGFILIDPTGDIHVNSVFMTYTNLPKLTNKERYGALVVPANQLLLRIPELDVLPPFRDINGPATPFSA